MSGSANGWPFLYHGMEQESFDPSQYYYTGNGAYYSAQIMRSMSMTGAQGTKGPTGDASGIVGGDGMALSGGIDAAAIAAQAAYLDAPTEETTAPSGGGGICLLCLIRFEIWEWDQFFGGGGGGPTYRQQLMELRATQGGRHPLYSQILRIARQLITSMRSNGDNFVVLAQASRTPTGTGSSDPLLDPNVPQDQKDEIARALQEEMAGLPVNSKQRNRIKKRLDQYRKRPSRRAHGADKGTNKFVPIIPEAPLGGAADFGLPGAEDGLLELLGALAF